MNEMIRCASFIVPYHAPGLSFTAVCFPWGTSVHRGSPGRAVLQNGVGEQGRCMGDHYANRDYNYDLGNHLLILRTRTALTQIALAEQIGVHRRSVQKWETGESYPKAEMLRRLIALFLHHHAFTAG